MSSKRESIKNERKRWIEREKTRMNREREREREAPT